jgi:hypothetical protein
LVDHTNKTYCKTAAEEAEAERTASDAFKRFDEDVSDLANQAIENSLLNQHEHPDDDDDDSGNSSQRNKKRRTTPTCVYQN